MSKENNLRLGETPKYDDMPEAQAKILKENAPLLKLLNETPNLKKSVHHLAGGTQESVALAPIQEDELIEMMVADEKIQEAVLKYYDGELEVVGDSEEWYGNWIVRRLARALRKKLNEK